VVKNTVPSRWTGRKYDIAIVRDGKLFLQIKDVNVGNQAEFQVNPKLYFAVVRNVVIEQTVHIGEVTTGQMMFDLTKYPTGLNVYLYKSPGGGRYQFKGSPKVAH